VTGVSEGSRVLVSCISGCGRWRFCRTGAYGQCIEGGGWVLGHLIDGTQAEYVRVPFADLSLHLIPDRVSDPDALMLADIMPTAYEVGVLNGRVSPADTVGGQGKLVVAPRALTQHSGQTALRTPACHDTSRAPDSTS
jgi:alcohol dehydrogenase